MIVVMGGGGMKSGWGDIVNISNGDEDAGWCVGHGW